MIKVVNKKYFDGAGTYTYIGRPSVLGNPYKIGVDGDRDTVISKYRVWLRSQWLKDGEVKKELLRLAGISNRHDLMLVCFCSPLPCHGDVLKEAIEKIAHTLTE